MKKPDFKITATASMKDLYRDLLEGDLSEDGLEEVLALVRRVFETSGYRISFDWEERSASKKRPYEIPAAANDYLKE